jgi:SAM-dependent methyltransferase
VSSFLFDTLADRYEAWFSEGPGRVLFAPELASVERVAGRAPRPWVEVGAGTGAFAVPLRVDLGIDPSRPMLERARARGLPVAQGVAEALPLRDQSAGTVFLIVTLCFLDDPVGALRQVRRALRPAGTVVLAEVTRDSPWG